MKFFKGSFLRELYHGDDVGIFHYFVILIYLIIVVFVSGTRENT